MATEDEKKELGATLKLEYMSEDEDTFEAMVGVTCS